MALVREGSCRRSSVGLSDAGPQTPVPCAPSGARALRLRDEPFRWACQVLRTSWTRSFPIRGRARASAEAEARDGRPGWTQMPPGPLFISRGPSLTPAPGRLSSFQRGGGSHGLRCGTSSVGRASASQAEGRGFETRVPLRSRFAPRERAMGSKGTRPRRGLVLGHETRVPPQPLPGRSDGGSTWRRARRLVPQQRHPPQEPQHAVLVHPQRVLARTSGPATGAAPRSARAGSRWCSRPPGPACS